MKLHLLPRILACAAFGLLTALAAPAQSLTYFMELVRGTGPDLTGSVVAKGYEGQIEVVSYSFVGNNPVNIGSSEGGSAAKFSFEGLECVMQLDPKAYPGLLTTQAIGGHFNELILRGVQTTQGGAYAKPEDVFFTLQMKPVLIETIAQQGTNGDQPVVSVVFKASAIKITTQFLKPDGTLDKGGEFKWNMATGKAEY